MQENKIHETEPVVPVQHTSEQSDDVNTTSEQSEDVQNTSEQSEDVNTTSEQSDDVNTTSEQSDDVNTTSEQSDDVQNTESQSDETPEPEIKNQESYAFSTDINQLLSLIINTFYSNKDVFLRELISNASDALDKIRYQSITDSSILGDEEKLEIRIVPDKESKTLVIEDTGIGMTRADLVNNLGTIAKSGTKSFMEALEAGADISMIGQFGVGFYSSFLVADRVTVASKHNDDDVVNVWDSRAGGAFTVYESDVDIKRGTRITLHLKEDMEKYLEENTMKEVVKRHSEFVDFPLQLWTEKTEEKEVTDDEVDEVDEKEDQQNESVDSEVKEDEGKEEQEEQEDEVKEQKNDEVETEKPEATEDQPVVDDGSESEEEEEEQPKKKTKTVTEVRNEWDHLNSLKPIWLRKPDDVTQEEHASFYKSLSNDWDEHLGVKHFSVEGQLEFKALLYVPKKAQFDMFNSAQGDKKKRNIKLYVRRVFITDESEEIMPEYLSFVKGVVDSDDLPLNVSRETLQQNKIMRVIRKNLIKKSIELFSELAENDEKYRDFYKSFSKNIKLGIHEDSANREKLSKLLRFSSTRNADENGVSLEKYVEHMKENQKGIYYIIGENQKSLEDSPFLEVLRSRDIEVLYMTDAIDEYSVQQLKDFDGKKLINVTKEGLELDDDEDSKKRFDELKDKSKELCETIKETLQGEIEKVVVSTRIQDSPCCLVTSEYGWSANMERIMKAQALADTSQHQFMSPKKTMEINPEHPIISKLMETELKSESTRNLIWLMYESSLLNSGFSLDRPTKFTNRINRLIGLGLGIDEVEDVEENNDPIPELNDADADADADADEEEGTMEEVD